MKKFKELTEELFTEGGEMYPADEMTINELKVACYAAQNILERLENGAMIQRWQISAIVKAKEELASVYTNMSADEVDDEEWEDEDEWEDEEPMYVGFEYPSMYGEEVELDEASYRDSGARNMMRASQKADREVDKMRAQAAKRAEKEAAKKKPVEEEVDLDESEQKYVVKGKSPFYKQDHYINTHETPKAQLIKKNIKQATRMNLETAKKVAKDWESHPNKYKTEVVPVNEETDYEVDVEGLPKMYVKGDNPSQVKNNLRKVVKNPEMIRGVERVAKATLQKMFRDKASGKELEEEKLERHKNTVGAHHLERDSDEHKMYTRYYGSLNRREHTVTDKDDNILGQGLSAASAMSKAKLKKPHRDALMHDDNQIVIVHKTPDVGTQVKTPGKGRWFKDHDDAMAHAKSLPGKIRYADKTGHVD